MTVTGGGTAMALEDLRLAAGAGPAIMEYFAARGIKTVPTLALMAASRVQPLVDGYRKGTTAIVARRRKNP